MRSHHHPGMVPGAFPARCKAPSRWLIWLCLALLSTNLCRGEDPAETPSPSSSQILLLRNGAVLRGKILARGEDYLIQAPHGQVVVPGTLVRAACRDLREAFEVMQERAAAQSEGSAYVTLAKWCQSVQMFDEARASLELALNLDANLEEARHLLMLNGELQHEHRQSQRPRETMAETPSPRRDSEAHLGGLPKSLAKQFTTRIQPILTNSCSTASCHGPRSATGFRLERVPVGQRSERGAVERNLLAVSEHLDLRQPAQSPLLVRAKQAHGKPARPLWTGPTGKQQLAELQAWVREATPYLQDEPPDRSELVQSPQSGSTNTVDSPRDPELILAAAQQLAEGEADHPETTPAATRPQDRAPQFSPPARLPPVGGKSAVATEGARPTSSQRRSASQPQAETPPARLKPRPPKAVMGTQKSSMNTATTGNPPAEAPGRDLFDPEEFNRTRMPKAD